MPPGMDHSDALWDKSPSEKCTLMLRRRASWCLLWGFSPNRPQGQQSTTRSHQPPIQPLIFINQSDQCCLPTYPPQQTKSTHPTNISSQLPLTPQSTSVLCIWEPIQIHSILKASFQLRFIHSFHFLSHQLYPRLSSSFLCFCFPAKKCSFAILPSWQTLSTNIFSQPHFDPLAPAAI